MWFVFNIIGIIICIITRLFCYITTFKVLKYEEFEEINPIVRKLLSYRSGKILLMIFGYSGPFMLLICNFMTQIIFPKFIWIITIGIFLILIKNLIQLRIHTMM